MLNVNHEILFGAFTNLFVIGWLALFFASFLNESRALRTRLLQFGGRIVPIVLLAVFVAGWLLTRDLPGNILSFEGVLLTNTVPEKVLAAWFEILGLALLVARWMIDDAASAGIPKIILAISLIGAFVAAATGLLAYLVMSRLWLSINNRKLAT